MEQFKKVEYKVEYFEVGYEKIEALVKRVYGKELEIPDAEELYNNTHLTYEVCKEPFDAYEQELLDGFINEGNADYGITRVLLMDMCNKDIIPAGNYLINVSW